MVQNEEVTLLCISDVHGKVDTVNFFVKSMLSMPILNRVDLLVAAGDIGNPQKPKAFEEVIEELRKLGKPIYYVKGNWDIHAPEHAGPDGVVDLDLSGPVDLGPACLVGHGKNLKPYRKNWVKPTILVTHYPPFSILDKGKKIDAPSQSNHAGMPEINYLDAYYRPVVHVFGHCHSLGGIDVRHNGVIYANVARLDRTSRRGAFIGNYALVTVKSSGEVQLRWRFLNGVWKTCSNCRQKVHLPVEWTLCRKCANRFDLGFKKLDRRLERVQVTVKELASSPRVLLDEEMHVPVQTLKDEDTYLEMLDVLLLKRIKEAIEGEGCKVLTLPKDKVIEYYARGVEEPVSFSEYLFACDESRLGQELCLLMKLYVLDKRAKVMWRLLQGPGGLKVVNEYVLAREDLVGDEGLVKRLLSSGFTPLLYTVRSV